MQLKVLRTVHHAIIVAASTWHLAVISKWKSVVHVAEPNQTTLCATESENGHNKPVNIMKQSKKKKVSRQRPHSATTGTSEASISARHNLNASANTHAMQMSPTVPDQGARLHQCESTEQ